MANKTVKLDFVVDEATKSFCTWALDEDNPGFVVLIDEEGNVFEEGAKLSSKLHDIPTKKLAGMKLILRRGIFPDGGKGRLYVWAAKGPGRASNKVRGTIVWD